MIIWSDLVYRCNDHVPEVIYNELPPRLQAEVEIDTTRPPAPVQNPLRKRRKKRNDEATGEEWEELFDDDELQTDFKLSSILDISKYSKDALVKL